MKLNKYIAKKLMEEYFFPLNGVSIKGMEKDIEGWIAEWYMDIYDKTPPIWLAGQRWYDRRKRIIKEAEEKSYEKDE